MPHLNRLSLLLLACTLGAAAVPACAAQATQARDAAGVTALSALPPGIREHLAAEFGDVSDPGGPFNPGCVVLKGIPRHRLVSASLANGHAVVVVEHGGIAHHVETLEFDSVNGRWEAVRDGKHAPPAPAAQSK